MTVLIKPPSDDDPKGSAFGGWLRSAASLAYLIALIAMAVASYAVYQSRAEVNIDVLAKNDAAITARQDNLERRVNAIESGLASMQTDIRWIRNALVGRASGPSPGDGAE